ncbi:MAG TPA: 3-phosphoshikimate 1-carboxyvinyltransferase [Spirochaetota bacterium]|jgi:3-phosphoshikimate 1-carboxyvinyltransferase|nr:3-phosphoshikimate 1-carboxyvinyltransferase [Spirochaetota bacterium]HOV09755.1 3-phosphoshikimate 1-carboxyvinyltransferase [Spirochaetota bacterium]
MKKFVSPSKIKGSLKAPASKSAMQRAIAAALLSRGESLITNPTFCDDSISAMRVAQGLGAKITKKSDYVSIYGGLNPQEEILNCGESGLCIRMFTPIAALTGKRLILTGERSLMERPVSSIEESIKALGANIKSNNSKLPIEVWGTLKGGTVTVDGSISSQFITGLLMALPKCSEDSTLYVKNLKSAQYVDLTIEILKNFGVLIEKENHEKFTIKGNQEFVPGIINIEGDWSGAAFLLCAGAIAGEITVHGIAEESTQPDRAIITALKKARANLHINGDCIHVSRSELKGFEFDASDCPDLFPPLAALALYCKGETILHGTDRLTHKESNRAMTIKSELEKLGARVRLFGDSMIIESSEISGGEVDSHGDHRIAMACAIAALGATSPVVINNAECVSKSYSEFFEDLKLIGGQVR